MLLADVMECSVNAALEDGKVAVHRVGVSIAAHVPADTVVDRTVTGELAADFFRCRAFVGHDVRFGGHLLLKDGAEIVGIDGRNVVRADLAAKLDKRKYGFLANAASALVLALAAMLVLLQSTDERFVNFNRLAVAAKRDRKVTIPHSLAQAMAHEPRGFVRQLKRPMYLMGADAFLARGQQVRALEPLVQRNMARFENRVHSGAELKLALKAALGSIPPQCGQPGPFGQMMLSRRS